MIFGVSNPVFYKQLAGCISGVFLAMGISPLAGRPKFDYSKLGIYEIIMMILGLVCFVLLTIFGYFLTNN